MLHRRRRQPQQGGESLDRHPQIQQRVGRRIVSRSHPAIQPKAALLSQGVRLSVAPAFYFLSQTAERVGLADSREESIQGGF